MRAVIQRVDRASVRVEEQMVGEIGRGMLVLLGVEQGDEDKDLDYVVSKCCGMRIFEDDQGKMNLDLQQVDGAMLVVSQFTLLGDCRKGRRPSFINAADPAEGERQYEAFCDAVGSRAR